MQRNSAAPGVVDQLAKELSERLSMAPLGTVGVDAELLGRVDRVVENIRAMRLEDDYDAGDVITLPRLHVHVGQEQRFTPGYVIYRSSFEQVFKKAAAELDLEREMLTSSMPVYVYGPKGRCDSCYHVLGFSLYFEPGIGKSHALRYTAARLWHQRLHKDGKFRILYIPEWHKTNIDCLRGELMLCFHGDPDMHRCVARVTQPQHVYDLLNRYTKQRLVIILDQAFDRMSSAERKLLGHYFPLTSTSIRVVFASSPRFELQGNFLAGDPREAIPLSFMDRLSAPECVSMAVKLLCDMLEAQLAETKSPGPLPGREFLLSLFTLLVQNNIGLLFVPKG